MRTQSLSPWGEHAAKLGLLLVPLLALSLFMVAGAPATAALGRTGLVTYTGLDHNIWRVGADGADRRPLTDDGMSESPDWVPGGNKIAFASVRDNKVVNVAEGKVLFSQLYLMNADGSGQVRLSDGSGDDHFPAVTANGQRIVLLRNNNWRIVNGAPAHDTEIGSIRLDGTDYRIHGRQFATQQVRIDRYPARMSPDGTKIVFVRQAQGHSSHLQLLDVGNGAVSNLDLDFDRGTTDGTVEYLWPRFDPQGRILVLRRSYMFGPVDAQLIRVDWNGRNAQILAGGLGFEALANGFDVNWVAQTVVGARSPEMPGGMRPEEIYLYDPLTGEVSAPLDSGHAPSYLYAPPATPTPTVTPTPRATLTPTPGPPTPTLPIVIPLPSAPPVFPTPSGGAGQPTPSPAPPLATPLPSGPAIALADPLFYHIWERVDRAVKENVAVRSWIWGPQGHTAHQEPYGAGTRLVQYFDKARMEYNAADGDKPAFVSNGLLVVEMLSGRIQIGPTDYEIRSPASVQIGGDGPTNPAPSYAALARVASLAGENQAAAVGQAPVTAQLNADGSVGTTSFPATPRIAYFAPQTAHNIPDVFFNFLNQRGPIFVQGAYRDDVILDWVYTVGYPISEAYWTQMSIAGQVRNVLVQAYQRQVLTYLPDEAPPWNVQFGNVGLQYYQWRYGQQP